MYSTDSRDCIDAHVGSPRLPIYLELSAFVADLASPGLQIRVDEPVEGLWVSAGGDELPNMSE